MRLTHWVSYDPENMAKDYVMTACGEGSHIKYFSLHPTCQDKRCQRAAMIHRIALLRKAITRKPQM